jgi:hypothetical protein
MISVQVRFIVDYVLYELFVFKVLGLQLLALCWYSNIEDRLFIFDFVILGIRFSFRRFDPKKMKNL